MAILQKIKRIVEDSGFKFYYDSQNSINKILDNVDFSNDKSVVYCYLFNNMKLVDGMESGNVVLFFCKKTDFDFNSDENESIIDECLIDARQIEVNVKRSNMLTIDSDILTQRFYDTFAVNVTGIAIDLTLSETYGLSECMDGTVKDNNPDFDEVTPQP